MREDPSDSLSRRQRWLGTAAAVVVAIIVMVITDDLVWGIVTFLLSGIVTTIVTFQLRERRRTR